VLLTTRFLDVAKLTSLTPLSLLSWWTLFKNSSLFSEVFQSTQHSFRRNFCSGVSSFCMILAQTLFISKCSVKIVWTDDFPKPSSSAVILTVNRRSLNTRERTRSMFSLPLEVEGRPDLASSLGSSRPSRKRYTHLKTVLSFRPLSINQLQHLMNFGAILAQFHKKLDVNPLFKLLIDFHFNNVRKRVSQKTNTRSLSF